MAATDALRALRPRPAGRDATVPRPAETARALAALGTVVCAAAVTLAAAGSPGNEAFGRGLVEALIVGTPIIVGAYALRAPCGARFGIALLAIGFLWSLTAMGQTSASIPYTVGRLATWCVFP